MQYIVQVEGLTKRFGSFTAVDELSFSIKKGSVYGFLGQNGAGKSTTMRMMLGLIHPTSGSVSVNGIPFNENRKAALQQIGAIIERTRLVWVPFCLG